MKLRKSAFRPLPHVRDFIHQMLQLLFDRDLDIRTAMNDNDQRSATRLRSVLFL